MEKPQRWFDADKAFANPGGGSERKPSLSQWLDLEHGDANPLNRRLKPGGKRWSGKDAKAILDELNKVQVPQRKLFVRWLRAEMRRSSQRKADARPAKPMSGREYDRCS